MGSGASYVGLMRLGIALPFHTGPLAATAKAAEEAGFDSLWVLDAHNRGFMLPDPFVALGIAAAVTDRVELGSSVVQVPLRSPFLLAEQVASVAAAAHGRLLLGVGAGSTRSDFEALGIDFADRFRLMDEHLGVMRVLLAGGDDEGHHLSPWPSTPHVPVLMGSFGSPRWLRKAATEFDGWIASIRSRDLAQVVDGLERFRDLAGDKRAIAANLDGARPDAAEILAALADAGFDDATMMIPRHEVDDLERARKLWPG
jgi:alkanesulfonate monooxygenase SsuD/methylene tetrahydromethanopterin reductase-like flavin-dependent oxidoreductase (luciferase family)